VLLKLRTMRTAAAGAEQPAFPEAGGLTSSGRLLRRLSLDELPQLVNVARGDMSLVGPRPTLTYQVLRYDERQRGRLAARPGLTGLAQIHGRNRMTWPERIEWDLSYLWHLSLRLDLVILARTAWAVLGGDGVSGHPRRDPIAQCLPGGTPPRNPPAFHPAATTPRNPSPIRRLGGDTPAARPASPADNPGLPGVTTPRGPPPIRLAKPDIGEEEVAAVRDVLCSGTLTNGPQNAAFELEFAARHGAAHGVTFASGTAALAAILLAEGIGPGDEVIVPSMTFISTATSVCHAGATPVFADINPRSFNLDPAEIGRLVTPATRAVLTVHYAGQPGDMDALRRACARRGLLLLEDAAQAAGADYRGTPVGTFGHAAMFSFTPTKNMTTGEGGIVLTSDADLAARLRLLRNHGQRRLYEHVLLGYNWRLTEMQAAIGRVQLRKLDAILDRKRANAAWMTGRLTGALGVEPPFAVPGARPAHMLYTCLVDADRDAVAGILLERGIETRVYFPPAHTQPIFAGQHARLPQTEKVATRMISLPMHSRLTPAELRYIADTVEEAAGMAGAGR
jgi:perosamine synthetase